MISISQALLLSETITRSLKNARIGWDTYTRTAVYADLTVSGETAAGPRDAPLRPDTVEYWEPDVLPATWDHDFGSIRDIDYVGLVANLGTVGCAVEARISEDVADFNDYLSLAGVDANYASTGDTAANSITGDLHVELELAIDNADLPDFSLDFLGDFAASVAKITGPSPTIGTFVRAGNTATRVNSNGVIEAVLAHVMRESYHPVTRAIRGLLVEEARTNLGFPSEDLSTSWVNINSTESVNATTAPDGALTADKLVEDATASVVHRVDRAVTKAASALAYAASVWVKAAERSWIRLVVRDNGTGGLSDCYFNVGAGAVGTASNSGSFAGATGSIQAYADGWYRCDLRCTSDTGTQLIFGMYLATGNGTSAYSGDGTSGAYFWGMQLEQAATASTYIPTTTASVLRASDVTTITDLTAMGFNESEGTIVASGEVTYIGASASFPSVFAFNNNTTSEEIQAYVVRSTGALAFKIADGGATQMEAGSGTITNSIPFKLAGAYKLNDSASVKDGASVSTDAACTLPTVDRFRPASSSNGNNFLNGWLREFYYYATRRQNATLQDFSRATYRVLASKWVESGNQRSWALCLKENCALVLFVSTDGTAAGIREYHSNPLTFTEGQRFRVRVKLDIATGSPTVDSVCTFQTSDDDGDTWDTLSTVTQATVTGIYNSTASLEVGAFNGGTSEFQGKVFQFMLYADLNDSEVAHFDAADGENGDTSVVSSDTGETWTINSTGPATALTIKRFSAGVAPADDAPIMLLDETRSARRLRLTFTGTTPPRVFVIYDGVALAMERAIRGGYTPPTMGRETELKQPLSRGGQFLGQSYRRLGLTNSAPFTHLSQDWVRETFEPFAKAARRYPFFFAWRPEVWPDECGFMWATDDIRAGYMGLANLMSVQIPMRGVGNE